jgi:rhodanese-related sulfurtransferase
MSMKSFRPGGIRGSLITKRIVFQLASICVISVALGLAFNSGNPIGIHFPPAQEALPTPTIEAKAPAAPPALPLSTAAPRDLGLELAKAANVAGKIPRISWAEVKPLLAAKTVLLVDARPKSNYDHGHIPGAVSLPYSHLPEFSSTPEDFAAFQKQYPKDTPIVVYCTTVSCQLSQIIAEKLAFELGYTNVRKMQEGYLEYSEAENIPSNASAPKLPAADPVAIQPASLSAALTNDLTSNAAKSPNWPGKVPQISWVEIKPLLAAKAILLVDARPKSNYDHGHIPGAVSLPYSHLPQFSSTPEDFAAFQKQYPKDTPIVVYCTTVSCQLSQIIAEKLAFELGYTNVRKMKEGYLDYPDAEKPSSTSVAGGTQVTNLATAAQISGTQTSASQSNLKPATGLVSHGKIPHIAWTDVKPLLAAKKIVLVDARPKSNYDHGHIPGAVSLPYSPTPKFSSTPEDFAAFQKQYPKDTPLVVYCTTVSCQLSQIIAEKLVDELGYTDVRKMNEGYLEYSEAELPSSKVAATNSSTSKPPQVVKAVENPPPLQKTVRNPSRTSWAAVKPLLDSGKIVMVDVRQATTYELGHIPGAVSLPYTSKEDAYIDFQKKYPKDTHLVLYCTDVGCPLSMKMSEVLVERFGYQSVQHMTEGYAEWQRAEVLGKNSSQ